MKRRGVSYITFNRIIKEGNDALVDWISNANPEDIAKNILKLHSNKKYNKHKASSKSSKEFIKKILGETKTSKKADIEYNNLHISIKNAYVKEYATRSKGWTFNFIKMSKFDYILLVGHDKDKKFYWLLSKEEMKKNSPRNTWTQTLNGTKSFSFGLASEEDKPSWKKYLPYKIDINNLKRLLDEK